MSNHRRSMAGRCAGGGLCPSGRARGWIRHGRRGAPSRRSCWPRTTPISPTTPAVPSALLVRVDRLENKLRSMTGQIEQLQFQNKRLEDALRKMQQDVDFRFQDLNHAPWRQASAAKARRPRQCGAPKPSPTRLRTRPPPLPSRRIDPVVPSPVHLQKARRRFRSRNRSQCRRRAEAAWDHGAERAASAPQQHRGQPAHGDAASRADRCACGAETPFMRHSISRMGR